MIKINESNQFNRKIITAFREISDSISILNDLLDSDYGKDYAHDPTYTALYNAVSSLKDVRDEIYSILYKI